MPHDPYLWTPAPDWAAARQLPTTDVERRIREGTLEGEYRGDGWYVARRPVSLNFPDPADRTVAELHLLALKLGRYLTAARREFVLPLRADDPDLEASLETLLEYLQGPLVHPVPFRLDGRNWCVDSSLHLDLVMTILEFEVAQHTATQPAIPAAGAA